MCNLTSLFHVEISNDISSQKQRKLKAEIEDFKAFFINCLFASFQTFFLSFFPSFYQASRLILKVYKSAYVVKIPVQIPF